MKPVAKNDLWIVLLLAALVVFISFPSILLHPNASLFTIGGDGIKNYFTVLYYLKYNEGIHFNGMNYPFGEHLSFADAQPGLSVPLHWLSLLFPALKKYGIACINYAVLLGIVAGSGALYLLLRQLKTQRLLSITGALLITFLSPQLFRIESHYGLSYIFAFPLSWFLYLKAEEELKSKWMIAAMLFISWAGLLHFYLAVITSLYLLGYAFFSTLTNFKKEKKKRIFFRWIIPAGAMVLLQLLMLLTDTVTDRPVKPWGFFTALSTWSSVFLPHPSDFLVQSVKEYTLLDEGFSYIGVVPVLFLFLFFIVLLVKLVRCRWYMMGHPFSKQELLFGLSSCCLLLFSMGIPFIWNLEWLTDKISFLRQFRGLGRFAWTFYYTSAVFAVVAFSRWQAQLFTKPTKFIYTISLSILFLVWTAEAGWRMKTIQHWDTKSQRNYLLFMGNNYNTLLTQNGIFPDRYQAILCLPYHHIGSEKFALDKWPSPYYAMKAAYQTGIPSMNVMLSRTSLSQSSVLMQLTGDTLLHRSLLPLLPSQKPLLLITFSNGVLSADEESLVKKSRMLLTDGEITFHELPVNAFKVNDMEVKNHFQKKDQLFFHHTNYWSNDPSAPAILNYVDTTQSLSRAVFINESTNKKPLLLDTVLNGFSAGDTMQISLWIEIEPEKDELPVLLLKERHKGKDVGSAQFPSKTSREVVGNRIRLSGDYALQQSSSRLILSLHMGSRFANLLIRKKGVNVFVNAGKSGFLFNNLPVDEN